MYKRQTPNDTDGDVEDEPRPEPVPDNTMTFSEYMASKGTKEETKLRKVTNEFEGAMAKVSVEDDFCVMGGGKQKKTKAKKGDSKKKVEVFFRTVRTYIMCSLVCSQHIESDASHHFLVRFLVSCAEQAQF